MANGITVELAVEDRVLADRLEAMLRDLGVDLAEPGSDADAIAITDVLPEGDPDRAVILLADDVDLIAALRAGAAGVLPTSVETADLRIALEAVLRGLAVAPVRGIDPAERDPIEPLDDLEGVSPDSVHLTSREIEVLSLLAEGASNKEIARKLGISVHTAKFHVASILEKLDANGRTDAVAHAVRRGLLML
jgi:DNA-binding NarL/FixJ family response regulator